MFGKIGLPELIILLVFALPAMLLYFLPSIIAFTRKKQNAGAIVALNILLGWSVIGWIVALVWALTTDMGQQVITTAQPRLCSHCGKYNHPTAQFCSTCGSAFVTTQTPARV